LRKRKPSAITVRKEWMHWHPKRMYQWSFWLAVGHKVKARGVRHKDRVRVMQIVQEVENNNRRKDT